MNFDTETTEKLKAFARDELTWAEVQGMSHEDAKMIAETGCELAAAGRLEEARILFEGLVEVNPKDSAAHAALGTVYQKLERIEDAVAEYSAALGRDPKNPVALGNRGELYLRRGRHSEGVIDLAAAVAADPSGETTAGRRSKLLLQAIAEAAVEAERAGKLETTRKS